MTVEVADIIQIVPPGEGGSPIAHWAGCLLVVDEVRSWGVIAYITIPKVRDEPPGTAFIRLNWSDFEAVGAKAVFIRPPSEDEG